MKKIGVIFLMFALACMPRLVQAQQDSCTISTLPYSEDFSTFPQGMLAYSDSCWSSLFYITNEVPSIVLQGIGGGKCLQLSGDFGTYEYLGVYDQCIAIMPPLATGLDASDLMVSFYLRTNSLSSFFEVGVMTDPINTSTFVSIDTVYSLTTAQFYLHHVYLNNYTGDGQYIAFRWTVYNSGFDTQYAWVDDITIEMNPGCPMVEHLTVSDITGMSALLQWDDDGNVFNHTIEYLSADSSLTSITGVVGDHFVLSGLTPSTPYTVYVTSHCENGTSSNPDSISFTTACLSGGDLLFGEEGHIVSRSFPIHKYSLSEEIYTASEIGAARNLQSLSFHCTSANTNRNIALYLMPVEQSVLTQFINLDSSAVKVYDGNVTITNGWVTIYFDENYYYDGASNLIVVIDDNTSYYGSNSPNAFFFVDEPAGNMIRIYNTWSTNYNPSNTGSYNGTLYHYRHRIKFGDVCNNLADCVSPYIYVDNITATSADVNIIPGNYENLWTVEYRKANEEVWITDSSVTANPFSLNGLTPGSLYYVRVNPYCGSTGLDHWATRSFYTKCGPAQIPYVESFEDANSFNNGFLQCWQRHTTDAAYIASINTDITQAHDGERYLTIPADSNCEVVVVLPEITTPALNSLQVEFYLSHPGNCILELGVMTDPDDAYTFQPLGTITTYSTDNYEKIIYPLLQYNGNGHCIAFRMFNGQGGVIKLDDLTVSEATGCYMPLNVNVSNITPFSAEIAWTDPGNGTQWSIEYGVTGFTPGTGTVVSTGNNPFTLTGLLADHTYDFYLRSDCDTNSHSDWTTVYTFSTPCYEIDHFPFTENFNVTGTGNGIHNLPECWGRLNTQFVEIQFGNMASGSGGYLCFIYDAGIAVMPRLADYDSNGNPIDIRYLKLDLDARYYDNSDHITIGVMTDPNDANTFQTVKEINVGYDYSTNFRHDTVFFYSYTGTGRYIAVKNRYASYAVADNFVISQLDYSCSAPEGLTCGNIGSGSAMVTWQTGAVGDVQEYTLQYKTHGDSTWVTAAQQLTETHYLLSNLNPQTWYDVRVRTLCTDSTYGEWATTTFQTECISGGYAQIGEGTSTSAYLPSSYWYQTITRQLFYQYEIGGAGNIYSVAFQVNQPLTLQRNWRIFLQHTSLNEFGYDVVLDNLPPVQVFAGTVNFHDGWFTINFDTPFYYNGTSNLVLTVQDTTGVQASASNYYYVHTCQNAVTASSSTLAPDHPFDYQWSFSQTRNNVIFQTDCNPNVTCGAPNLFVESVSGNEAQLIWAAGYQETQWELEYKQATDTSWTPYNNPTDFQVTLTGLQLLTPYEVRMRSVCDAGNVSEWTSVSFTTGCGKIEVLPYTETFEEELDANNFVECWQRLNTTATVMQNNGVTPGIVSNHCLKLTHDPASAPFALAVLPELGDDIVPSDLAVFMSLKSSDPVLFEVGMMTNPADTASFVVIGTLQPGTTWSETIMPLASYTGSGKFIALRMRTTGNSAANVYVDDLEVTLSSLCLRPADLTATDVFSNSATLQWRTFSPSATAWNIEYGLLNFALGTGTSLTVTDTTATLTGLAPATAYTACVRTDCGNEYSDWQCVSFNTPCGPVTPPYLEDFEAVTSFPDCWTQQYNTGSIDWNVVTPTSNPQGAHSGTQAICMKNNSYTSYITTLVTPMIRLQNIINPTLSFLHTQKIWGNDQDTLAVFYRTTPSGEWTLLVSYNQDIPSWTRDTILLPNPTNTYQLAFQGTVRYGYGIYLDDISVTGEIPDIPDTCEPATNLTASDIGNYHITVNWTPGGDEDYWMACYREAGNSIWDSIQTTAPTVTIDNLQGLTEYEVFVRTYCDYGLPASSDTIAVSTTNIGIPVHGGNITLYPNPTNGLLTITSSESPIIRIEIGDLVGRVIWRDETKENTVRVDISGLPNGVYFAKVTTTNGESVRKVVKR